MSNMVVKTNIFALNAHRNLKNVGLDQVRASSRLSSGYRISTAADDAAGLAISETMRAQIRGLDQASSNAQDTQALVMTTEGGLQEITNMLQRARELTVQAANDTNVSLNRNQISYEIGHLAMEISQMQMRVEFNTRSTLSMGGSAAELHFQIGANAGQSLVHNFEGIRFAINDASDALILLSGALGMNVGAAGADAWTNLTVPSAANGNRAAIIVPGEDPIPGDNRTWTQLMPQIVQNANVPGGVFITGNELQTNPDSATIGATHAYAVAETAVISALLEPIQDILDNINIERAQLGALVNRLDYTMRSLDISSENLSDSESRIRDADMAREMMRFTQAQVLQQAGVSMLAQANNMPNNLLQLLN